MTTTTMSEQEIAHLQADVTMGKTFGPETVGRLLAALEEALNVASIDEYERGFADGKDEGYAEGFADGQEAVTE